MIDTNGRRQSFLSTISGTVTKIYIHESNILSYGSILLEYEECRHTVTFKNLCGDCGIDLNQLTSFNSTKSLITMEPSFPEITITREEGSKYDDEERNYLFRKRKLHLLVDLDQTLIHTTNGRHFSPSSPDVVSYQLTPVSPIFHTKLRPGVKEFLTNLHPFYQFHLVTFGDRQYANTIAKLIDPNKTFFSHRILSRDECLSLTDKSANLSSLFPSGDSLVCIIDDREDVWNNAPNLVQVKPYTWFRDVGDINNIYLPPHNEQHQFNNQNDDKQIPILNQLNLIEDTDVYLYQLENILKRIHNVFYSTYDQWIQDKHGPMPDLKQIMPIIRQQILHSVSLCLSHMMPQYYSLEKHPATILARAMGAQVTSDLQFDSNGNIQTTHVIAGKRTFKVHQARQNKIHVVTPDWLTDCYEQWEKKPEENYIFTSHYNVRRSRLFIEETPRVTKRRHCDIQEEQPPTVEESISYHQDESTTNVAEEPLNIEERVNDLCTDGDDELNDIRPPPKKQRHTMIITQIINEKTDNRHHHEDSGSDSDSSYNRRLYKLVIGKEDNQNSDEEELDDDRAPRGWKDNQNKEQSHVAQTAPKPPFNHN